MWSNTTLMISEYIQMITTRNDFGPIIFIVVVILWYSSSIAFLLKMQTGASTEIFHSSTEHPTSLLVQNFRHQRNNTEVLKELVDKQKRDKLWDIYLGDVHDKISAAETLRIRNIEKQLAVINQHRQNSLEGSLDDSFVRYTDSDSLADSTDASSINSRLRPRRRSSLDHRILEQWRVLADELRPHGSWPWPIQKLFIRRHLRQRCAMDYGSVP